MPQQTYYTELPRRILEAIAETMGAYEPGEQENTGFKTYWEGDPIIFAESHLPALVVDWEEADNIAAPTGHDRWQDTITIKLILNKMADAGVVDFSGNGTILETPTKKRLQRLIFARDKTTGQYLNNTVMGILRRNFTMQGGEVTQKPTVIFGNSQRPGQKELLTTAEAHIRITAKELVQVPVRS